MHIVMYELGHQFRDDEWCDGLQVVIRPQLAIFASEPDLGSRYQMQAIALTRDATIGDLNMDQSNNTNQTLRRLQYWLQR